MNQRIDSERREAAEVALLHVQRRWLEHDLQLVVVLKPVRIVTVAAIGRPSAGLDVDGLPRVRAQRPERGCRVKGPGTDFHVKRLQHHAAVGGPVVLQGRNQALERGVTRLHGAIPERATKNAQPTKATLMRSSRRMRAVAALTCRGGFSWHETAAGRALGGLDAARAFPRSTLPNASSNRRFRRFLDFLASARAALDQFEPVPDDQ